MKYTVNADPSLRVRSKPSTTGGEILGQLPPGAVVDATISGAWASYEIAQSVGGVNIGPRTGYSSAAYLAPVAPPPVVVPPTPAPANKIRIGLNLLHNHGYAEKAYGQGVRVFQFMDGQLAATQFHQAHPDATVMVRRYVTSKPSVGWHVFENGYEPGLVYLSPMNENDVIGGDAVAIRERAKYDAGMWALAKANGCTYAGGGFSVGTPDFTSDAICAVIKEVYAPLWADGMWMNFHLYSPQPYKDPSIWFELRPEFLFTKCGFTHNTTAKIVSDELGIDAGAIGGLGSNKSGAPSFGMSAAAVGAHTRMIRKAFAASLFGQHYGGGAWFQCGPGQGWDSFDITYASAEIGAANQD